MDHLCRVSSVDPLQTAAAPLKPIAVRTDQRAALPTRSNDVIRRGAAGFTYSNLQGPFII